MKPRVIVLLLAAAVILSLVQWRLRREQRGPGPERQTTDVRRLAPRFELYDQHSQLVKFERYLGRTRILLLFIADTPIDQNPLVLQLARDHAKIEDSGVQIIVVGTTTPFAIREAEQQRGEAYPFPVLTDINQQSPEPAPTHRQWGLAGDDPGDLREGLFPIERDGTVTWAAQAPQPTQDPQRTIDTIAMGDWTP